MKGRSRFRVGDKVRLVRLHPALGTYAICPSEWGKTAVIIKIDLPSQYGVRYFVDMDRSGNRYRIFDCMLDRVGVTSGKNKLRVITSDFSEELSTNDDVDMDTIKKLVPYITTKLSRVSDGIYQGGGRANKVVILNVTTVKEKKRETKPSVRRISVLRVRGKSTTSKSRRARNG